MAILENSNLSAEANGLASDLAKVLYQNYFTAVENTLNRFHVQERAYSLLEIRDESTCLTCEDGVWMVFFSERGLMTNTKTSSDIEDACKSLMYEMAENTAEYESMNHYFNAELKNSSTMKTSSVDIYNVLKDGLKKFASTAAVL